MDLALSGPTPYAWAANVARQIGREATLLTYDGVGHVTYWLSTCMRQAIDSYLTTLTTPARGTRCPAVRPGEQARQRASDGGVPVGVTPRAVGVR